MQGKTDDEVDIDKLHEQLFGYRPGKHGTAYERIAAVVLATLGWGGIVHDVRERPAGRRALHQLDITAHHPAGDIRRLLIECKDLTGDKEVPKNVIDTLVGVRQQIGADAAAVITRKGFSRGARDVAVDEDVAMIMLDVYDPAKHGTNYVKQINLTLLVLGPPIYEDFDMELIAPPEGRGLTRIRVTSEEHLLNADGTKAEQIDEVLRAHPAPMKQGVFHRRAEFPSGERFITTVDGPPLEIRWLSWTVTQRGSPIVSTQECTGDPVLVLHQLDGDGNTQYGKLVISEDLWAWDINDTNTVVARGQLLAQPDDS